MAEDKKKEGKEVWDSRLDECVRTVIDTLERKYDDLCPKCQRYTQDCNLRKYEQADDLLNIISKYDRHLYSHLFSCFEQTLYNNIIPKSGLQIVIGGSMSPTLNDGDIIIEAGVPENGVNIGDIIGYAEIGGQHACHRVVGFTNDDFCVYTKGDNGSTITKVPVRAITSRVAKIVKKEENKELWDVLYSCMRRSSQTPQKK